MGHVVPRQRGQECDEIIHVLARELERANVGVGAGNVHGAAIVGPHHVAQGGKAAVVHVGARQVELAQRRHLEQSDVAVAARYLGAARIAIGYQAVVSEALVGVARAGVTAAAARFALEQPEPALLGRRERRRIAGAKLIDAVLRRELERLEARERGGKVDSVGALAVDRPEPRVVAGFGAQPLHGLVDWQVHLVRRSDRHERLGVQRGGDAAPSLQGREQAILQNGRVARARVGGLQSLRDREAVGER